MSYKRRNPLQSISTSSPFLKKYQAPEGKRETELNKQLFLWFAIFGFVSVYILSIYLYNETWVLQKFDDESEKMGFEDGEAQVKKVLAKDKNTKVDRAAQDINLEQGDPTMFEAFWQERGEEANILIAGWQTMSYYSDKSQVCWFLEPEFAHQIKRLHKLVGNAVTEDRHIVVGTGSTQLFQATLYALSPSDAKVPMSVVSAKPYYSSYPPVTDFLKSGLYRWAGDANSFEGDSYIELICAPNNPDGYMNKAVLNSKNGKRIYDYAYYWPQYTAITEAADNDIMLFTVSKSTGHAGTRLGWALVKDREVARKMTEFMVLNTIGVSKDSQRRAAKIMKVVSDGYELPIPNPKVRLFEYGKRKLEKRWKRLREVARETDVFSLPEYTPETCKFTGERTPSHPAFAWVKCEKDIEDCATFLKKNGILTRCGKSFGMSTKYVRISMLDRDEIFDLFIERLTSLNYG